MKLLLGVCCVITVFVAVITNALFMLVSPRAWYRLPRWIRLSGNLSERQYGSGWGAIQIRLLGAIFVGVIGWALFDSFSKHH